MQPVCCTCEKYHLCKHCSCPSLLSWWIHLWLLHCHLPVGTSHVQCNPLISPTWVPTVRVLHSYCLPDTFLFVVCHPSSHAFSSSLKLLNLSHHFPSVPMAGPGPLHRTTLRVRSKLPWYPPVFFHHRCSMLHVHQTMAVLTPNTNTTAKIPTCHMHFSGH